MNLGELTGKQVGDLVGDLLGGGRPKLPTCLPGPQLVYLPFFPADFFGNPWVDAMGNIAGGLPQLSYVRLLFKSWQMPEPCFLPNNLTVIAGMAGCTPLDLQGDWSIVLERFVVTEDGRYRFNYRLLREYWRKAQPYLAQVQAGKDRAEAKKAAKTASSSPDSLPTRSPSSLPDVLGVGDLLQNQNQNQNQNQKTPLSLPQERELTTIPEEIPDNLAEKVMEVWEVYPSAGRKRAPGQADQEAIATAIVTDGFDLVIAGARNYADAVAKWPTSDLKFIKPAARFFTGSDPEYLKNPAIWDKSVVSIKGVQSASELAAEYALRKAAKA